MNESNNIVYVHGICNSETKAKIILIEDADIPYRRQGRFKIANIK